MKKLFKTHPKNNGHGLQPQGSPIVGGLPDLDDSTHFPAQSNTEASIRPVSFTAPQYVTSIAPGQINMSPAEHAANAQHRHSQIPHSLPHFTQRERAQKDSEVDYGSSDDNWEVVHASDLHLRSNGVPTIVGDQGDRERKTSQTEELRYPYQPYSQVPVISNANSRSSSLNSLPPGASPPVPAPLNRAGSPYGYVVVPSPALSSQTNHVVSTDAGANPTPMHLNVLRKKNRDQLVPQSYPKDSSPVPSTGTGGPIPILRALEPSILDQHQHIQHQSPAKPMLSKRLDAGYQDNTKDVREQRHTRRPSRSSQDTKVSADRDSLDLEREMQWRRRDQEIFAQENVTGPNGRSAGKQDENGRESRMSDKEGKSFSERLQFRIAKLDNEDKRKADAHTDVRERERDLRRVKEHVHHKEREQDKETKEEKKPWSTLFSAVKDRDKDKSKLKDKEYESDQLDRLTKMIGILIVMGSPDWTLVFDVCERVSASENNAKAVAKALRKELKYGETPGQLSAAKLWAIILQNSSDFFIAQTSTRKFLDTVEELISSPRISPIVKDHLIDALGVAVYISFTKDNKATKDIYGALWRKVKPDGSPEEGAPIVINDRIFNPMTTFSDPVIGQIRSRKSTRRYSHNGDIIPVDEDIRRLFQECKIGRGNARLLSEALAFTTPDNLTERDIIKEFYSKCRASQELIFAQIPWASAGAEQSRSRRLEEQELRHREGTIERTQYTREEMLLAELLKANEELADALRMYDDLERIGVETEVERTARERSRVELRTTASGLQNNGHVQASSQSPLTALTSDRSTVPINTPTPMQPRLTPALVSEYHSSPPSQQDVSPLPTPTLHPSQTHLLPALVPTRAPLGPRSPISYNIRSSSRSPSPVGSTTTVLGSRSQSRQGSFDTANDSGFDHSLDHSTHETVYSGSPNIAIQEPPSVSEKAAGKKREVDGIDQNGENSHELQDDDETLRLEMLETSLSDRPTNIENPDFLEAMPDRWKTETHYVYDAAAERTKMWLKDSRLHGNAT